MPAMLDRLRERKLWQWAITYLAAAYVGLQLVDFVDEPWGLSRSFVRSAQILSVTGFVLTVVLAWYHGERGRQRVDRSELALLLLVLLGTVGAIAMVRDSTSAALDEEWAAQPVVGLVRIAVLPLDPYATQGDSAASDALIQQLFVLELARRRGLAVTDRLTLNTLLRNGVAKEAGEVYARLRAAGIDYAVRTTLTPGAAGSELRYWLVQTATGAVSGAGGFPMADEGMLPMKIEAAAVKLASALEESAGGIGRRLDLEPWVQTRAVDVAATREFLQGTEYSYRGLPGGGAHFQRALAIDSTFIAPRVWLVSGLVGRGDTAAAREHMRILHSLEVRASPFEQAMIGWADAVLRRDLEAKARHLQVALSYSPGNNLLLYNLGSTLWELDRSAEAVAALRPVVNARWPYSGLYVLWGLLCIKAGEVDGLRQTLEYGLQITPQEEADYLNGVMQALATYEADDAAAARHGAAFAQAVATNRAAYAEIAFVYRSLGTLAREQGAPDRAVVLLQRALDADPEDFAAQLELARVFVQTGERGRALSLYRSASSRAGDDPGMLYLSGEVAAALGMKEEALRSLNRYLELAPDGPDAMLVRERLRALRGS